MAAKSKDLSPRKSWGTKTGLLPQYVMASLHQVSHLLNKETRQRVGLMIKVPIFIKDPLVALQDPLLGVQEIAVRLDPGFCDGPTSSRIAVVDFNFDTRQLLQPVVWDPERGWFRIPPDGEWLPDAPKQPPKDQELSEAQKHEYKAYYEQFIASTVANPSFHQVNAWAVVQRVLEFYEDPQALGRAVPWGLNGNRLIVVPHAGQGKNAFYDRNTKSLRFLYFGDQDNPGYTCLSHDLIAHEAGHAVLDGIRPLYYRDSSMQTRAFHEFIGDLTAILLALFNRDIRHYLASTTKGDLHSAAAVADLAQQLGEAVNGRPYVRSAINGLTMQTVAGELIPHTVSQVLTGAMFDILIAIADKHMKKNLPGAEGEAAGEEGGIASGDEPHEVVAAVDAGKGGTAQPRRVTAYQALWWAADRFRRIALQPLDLCPPCDIQFTDYAKAVVRNDILTNPVDRQGYRQDMLQVFHERGLCTCGYIGGDRLPDGCSFAGVLYESWHMPKIDLVYHDIERLSSSPTAAYYFLSDNRRALRIPAHQDIVVVGLYDNSKLGAAAERLPREIVLEYLWEEQVTLQDDAAHGLFFGKYNGSTMMLQCGGTLVFDGRGNLLSWFRKPGTEHISPSRAQELSQKTKLTKQEWAELADLKEGEQRKSAFLAYLSGKILHGPVGAAEAEEPFGQGMKPFTAVDQGGVLPLPIAPHLRDTDFNAELGG